MEEKIEKEDGLVTEARKKFSHIDVIVNVFTLRIVWASERVATHLEYTQDEMINLPAVQITDLKPTDALKEATRLFNAHGKEYKPVVTKSGKEINMQAKIHAFLYNHEPHLIVTDMVFDDEQ